MHWLLCLSKLRCLHLSNWITSTFKKTNTIVIVKEHELMSLGNPSSIYLWVLSPCKESDKRSLFKSDSKRFHPPVYWWILKGPRPSHMLPHVSLRYDLYKKGLIIIPIFSYHSITLFDIVSDRCNPAPCYLKSDKLFLILRDRYCNSKWDWNLGPKRLSLLEFETWRLKPLCHHGRLTRFIIFLR